MKLAAVVIISLVVLITLYSTTGFLQQDDIDARDLAYWEFQDGIIKNADEFVLEGSSGTCWVMVHGYTSTPDEIREIAERVHIEFDDTVYAPRLYGHGMVPSEIIKYTVDDWYQQIETIAQENNCQYLLGSSTGASIALRYAEEHDLTGVVLAGVPMRLQPAYLPTGLFTTVLHPAVGYLKKKSPGESVLDKEGRAAHISSFTFPLKNVPELTRFNRKIEKELDKVTAAVLFLHAPNDNTAHISGAKRIFRNLKSEKEFVELEGQHIVFRDYDKEKAMDAVVEFRTKH